MKADQLHQPKALQRLPPKVVRSQLICSRPQPRLVQVDVVVLLAAAPAPEELIFLELVVQERLLEVWETSTSSEIIHNSSNSDKLFNRTLKCSSPSYNKLALGIHSWLLLSDNTLSSSYNF
jgi:hypothetical protein